MDKPISTQETIDHGRILKRENPSELPPMLPLRGPRPARMPKTIQQIDTIYHKHSAIHSESPAMRFKPGRADSLQDNI